MIPTFADLSFDTRANVIRLTTPNDIPSPALRLCHSGATPLLMTGPQTAPRFHDARAIITGMLDGSDEFELPLPAPVPNPLAFISHDPAKLGFLLAFAAGVERDFLKNKYGADFARATTVEASENGFTVSNATAIAPLITEMRESLARAKREQEAQAQIRRELEQGRVIISAEADEPNASDTPETPATYGVITKAPQAYFERMSRRAGAKVPAHGRIKWPFAQMEVGDRVSIDPKFSRRAQTAVHVYANRLGKRFTTHTNPKDGSLTVLRVEDKAINPLF